MPLKVINDFQSRTLIIEYENELARRIAPAKADIGFRGRPLYGPQNRLAPRPGTRASNLKKCS